MFLAAAALQLLYVLPNHDRVWLLIAAERMLEGGAYQRDFSETNPPLAILIHVPSFLVRAISGLDSYPAFIVLTLIYAGVSLMLLRKVVANGFPAAGDFQRWLMPVAALLLLPQYDFGQREHLISIFVFPYLAMHSVKPSHGASSRGLTVLIAAWACLGLFLKPVFLLLPILISLDRAIRSRSLRSLFSLDMITIGAMGLAYTALILIRFPDYFTLAQYALKFGAALVLIPFSFVYVPELLLIGEPAGIAYAALRYLAGYAVLAMGIQKTEFLTGEIPQWRRVGFIAAAICLLFPLLPYIEIAGFALAAVIWAPSVRTVLAARRAS